MIKKRGNPSALRNLWRNNGLSLVLFACFVVALVGQGITGWHDDNQQRIAHSQQTISLSEYLGSGAFLEVTMENWESEFLQMFVYVVLTVFLFQRGSSESKDPDQPEEAEPPVNAKSPYPVRAGGWRLKLYENSMSLFFLVAFLVTFFLHALGGVKLYNEEQATHGAIPITFFEYLSSSRFWFESLQNWQSEFLSLWGMVVVSIFLRQRGSPESKSVASSYRHTGR